MKVAFLTTDSREHFKDYSNPKPYFGAAPEALIEGFKQLPAEIEVHVISCLQKEPISSPAKLADNIYYHQLLVPNIGWLKTGYQGCIRRVRRRLQKIGPDIVHGQGTERDCAVSAVFSGYPNVITIHGNMAELARLQKASIGSFYWIQGRIETVCLRRSRGVFCNSLYTRDLVAPRANQCWLVPNAIRPTFLTSSSEIYNISKLTLLNVGVISPRKRQVELLELAHEMFNEGTVLRWRFVGSCDPHSEYGSRFLQLMERAKACGYAEYIGELTCDQLVLAMDQAHALVHFPYEEAFGLVAPEALARGLFVFSSDVGGLRDILNRSNSARLIQSDDFGALKTAIASWAKEDRGGRRPGPTPSVVLQYSPRSIALAHLRIYNSVAATNPLVSAA
jgi:glycosyltransferase involved in cell wall biosynthesis